MSKTSFINGDVSQKLHGTRVTAEFLNAVNNHHHTGLDEDGHGALPYVADTGVADTYVVNLSPALSTYIIGMPVYFKASNTNTGSSTININGLGAKSIKKNLFEDLMIGDITAAQIYCVVFDGANFQLITPPAQEKITASDILSDFVVTGLIGTDPGVSLTMTVSGGIAYVRGRRVVKLSGAADLTRTYTVSKDTYVDISHVGAITYIEVANGAGAPAVTANSIRLMKVVTNAAEITTITDLRTTNGVKIANSLAVQGESSTFGNASSVTMNVGTVTAGDIIHAEGYGYITFPAAASGYSLSLYRNSGMAWVIFGANQSANSKTFSRDGNSGFADCKISSTVRVMQGGTLELGASLGQMWGTAGSNPYTELYAFFLKKQ